MCARVCAECGSGFTPKKSSAEFCCHACRQVFNNRRAMRGAQLYDLVMTMRFDRKTATDKQVWSVLCGLASAFRAGDQHARDGRRSWRKLGAALSGIPMAYGKAGDGR